MIFTMTTSDYILEFQQDKIILNHMNDIIDVDKMDKL